MICQSVLAQNLSILSTWRGEYFKSKQGGFYLATTLKGSLSSADAITVVLRNPLRKRSFKFTADPVRPNQKPHQIWKIPIGKYKIVSVQVQDASGNIRTIKAKTRPLVVKKQSISNLGHWIISGNKKTLNFRIKALPDRYREKAPKHKSSVAYVIDGFSGLTQTVIGGKRVTSGAKTGYSTVDEARITITSTINISMTYALNLFRNNHHARRLIKIFDAADPQIRQCYTDRLESRPSLKGKIKFRFLISRHSRSMKALKKAGGMEDPKLTSCIYYKLGALTFPVNKNMIGEVTYFFKTL